MQFFIRRFTILLVVSALVAGCAGQQTFSGGRKRVKDPEQPEWVTKASAADTKSTKAFVGISNRQAGLPQSREEAQINAYAEAMNYVGMMVERAIRQVTSQTGFSGDNRLSAAVLRGEVAEYHTQHWETPQDGDWYETYALFLVPRDVLRAAALNMLNYGKGGRTPEELESMKRAQGILEGMSLDE